MNIPDEKIFKDREKEAAFWEKHYKETLKDGKSVDVSFAKNLSESINIRLDAESLDFVRSQAKQKGLGPTQLIRMWIMEKISSRNQQLSKV